MKHWYLIPLAALIGIAAGSFGPRSELETMRSSLEEAKAERASNKGGNFDAFAKMANIPDRAERRHRLRAEESAGQAEAADEPADKESIDEVETEEPETNRTERFHGEWMDAEDLEARIDEAAELWRTRVAIAKSQWKARLGVTGDDAERFDAEIDAMNDSLRETMAALAEAIAEKGRMTPELGLRMVGDATAVMAETYDRIGAIVSGESADEVSEMQVYEFIDPSVAEPLIAVQDMMR